MTCSWPREVYWQNLGHTQLGAKLTHQPWSATLRAWRVTTGVGGHALSWPHLALVIGRYRREHHGRDGTRRSISGRDADVLTCIRTRAPAIPRELGLTWLGFLGKLGGRRRGLCLMWPEQEVRPSEWRLSPRRAGAWGNPIGDGSSGRDRGAGTTASPDGHNHR